LWSVLPCLLAVTAAAAWLQRKIAPVKREPPARWDTQDRILLISSAAVGAVLLARSAVSPLIGFDTLFRWDFLAQRILALRTFSFYPPLTPADFRTYFFVDGIPPLVSFAHWWIYASAGEYLPSLTSIFVAAQFACTLAFTYGAASAIFSRRAGILAAAMLAASPLYFTAVVLGQETGLTALAIAAMVYFIVTAKPEDIPAMVSAGLAASLCALSREYGWIALIAGGVTLLWRRQSHKQIVIFAAVATAVAAPWYIRNWILAGNPFYSLRLGNFAVNPIHDAILQHYKQVLGIEQWTSANSISLLGALLASATFPILVGIPGGLMRFRRNGYLVVIVVLLTAVWIQAAAYTSGGVEKSVRVLSPAIVVLSIAGAGLADRWTARAQWRTAAVAVLLLWQAWTAAHGVFYPNPPLSLRPDQWAHAAFQPLLPQPEFQIRDQLASLLPAGTRVLTDNAYLHAALIDKGIEVVPVWSPEVRFLFTASADQADRQLRALRIATVAYYPQSLNTSYLTAASPFFAELPRHSHSLAQIPGYVSILVPDQR
jgi:hypothetical protein